MSDIKAHYDGKVFVPHEPVDLAEGEEVTLRVQSGSLQPLHGPDQEQDIFEWMAENAIDDDSLPPDLSRNHDHYLYGTPKRNP